MTVTAICIAWGGLASTASAAAEPGPPLTVPPPKLACPATFTAPGGPVLLVHGTSTDVDAAWSWSYVPALRRQGFDVCTVELPDTALGDAQIAAEHVVGSVRTIARRAGRPVAVIGHSQGGLEPRWAIRWWPDMRTLISDEVGLATTNHGAPLAETFCSVGACPAALWQQRAGSAFLQALNAGDETPGPGAYTSVFSETDTTAVAPTSVLSGAADIAVQTLCPGREVSHDRMLSDAAVFAVVLDALRHDGPARLDRVDRTICRRTRAEGMDDATGDRREQTNALRSVALIATARQLNAEPAPAPYVGPDPPTPTLTLTRSARRIPVPRTTRVRFDVAVTSGTDRWTPPGMCLELDGRSACAGPDGAVELRLRPRVRGLRCGQATALGVAPLRFCVRAVVGRRA